MEPTTLGLHHEIALLATDEESGSVYGYLPYGIGGSLLAEMLFQQRLELVPRDGKYSVTVKGEDAFEDAALEFCRQSILKSPKVRDLSHWVSTFIHQSEPSKLTFDTLCTKGILKRQEKKILWVFPRQTYPEADPHPELQLRERLRQAIFESEDHVDPRTAVLIGLTHQSHILEHIFPRKELKTRKKRLEDIANGELMTECTREIMEAYETSMMIATTTAATAAVVATTVIS